MINTSTMDGRRRSNPVQAPSYSSRVHVPHARKGFFPSQPFGDVRQPSIFPASRIQSIYTGDTIMEVGLMSLVVFTLITDALYTCTFDRYYIHVLVV